ncbi:MAG: hypothetical protein GY696_30345 [Gammaproteobacteria bacterium]|nr:hypothetical protein [Gammaproteobacteria bacterium]
MGGAHFGRPSCIERSVPVVHERKCNAAMLKMAPFLRVGAPIGANRLWSDPINRGDREVTPAQV